MGLTRLHLDEDNWRIMAAGGTGSVNFQFFIDWQAGGWIPYSTGMDLAFIQVQRRVFKRLDGGMSYVFMDFTTNVDQVENEFRTTRHGLGFNLSLYHRSSLYYPRAGSETGVDFFTYPSSFGNDIDADKLELEYNLFHGMRGDQDVLAGRFYAGIGLGDLSFNQ